MPKKKKVVFYSKAHVGDLHLTRHYVKMFPKWFPMFQFMYLHGHHPAILCDTEVPMVNLPDVLAKLPHDASGVTQDDSVFLNTWVYSCGNHSFCTFQSARHVMSLYFKWLLDNAGDKSEVTVPEFPEVLPQIDYEKAYVDTSKIKAYFNSITQPCIFFCNNYPGNNQAYGDDLTFFADKLAEVIKLPIFLTNKTPHIPKQSNVMYLEDELTLTHQFTLNSLSYASTLCPIIIGRGSGPFTYAEVKENLNKTWFSMTFPHVACDVFNGLQKYPNEGQYFHTQDEDIIMKVIQEKYV